MGGVASGVQSLVSGVSGAVTPQDKFNANDSNQQQYLQNAQTNLVNTQQGQQALAKALLAQSQGQGPNLAQAQLNQATDQNIKQNAGLIASQKGMSPALAARLAAENQASISQQSAGQGSILAGQQQLAAQNQLGGVYNNMATSDVQNSQVAQGGINNANTINSGVASGNAAADQKTANGMFNSLGPVASKVGGMLFAGGGAVPGHASVSGNSPKNDTVPAMLSPGEIVIPRSAAGSIEKAKAFIDNLKGKTTPTLKGESTDHFHFEHPDGSDFKIAKNGISEKLLKQIQAMAQKRSGGGIITKMDDPSSVSADSPLRIKTKLDDPASVPADSPLRIKTFADGGEVLPIEDDTATRAPAQDDAAVAMPTDSGTTSAAPVDNSQQRYDQLASGVNAVGSGIANGVSGVGNFIKNALVGDSIGADGQPVQPQAANPALAPTRAPDAPNSAPNDPLKDVKQEQLPQDKTGQYVAQGLKGQQDVLRDQLGLQDKIGQNEQVAKQKQADLWGQQLKVMQDNQALFDQRRQALDKESDQLQQALQSKAVDPDRLWNSKSTGSKVMSTIGILLSGLGSGGDAHNNMALNMLNKQIDEDIAAQKADINKQQNLLHYNMQKYQNLDQAEAATRAQLLTTFQAQMQQQAAQDGSNNAINIAKLAGVETRLKIQQLHSQIANMQVLNGSGGATSSDARARIAIQTFVPEKEQATAIKEYGDAKNHETQSKDIISAYDAASSDNTIGNRILHLGFEPASVARLKTAIMPYLKDAEGRINEQELERTDGLIPRPGDSAQKIQEKKLGMQQFLAEKSKRPTLDLYNVPYQSQAIPGTKGSW